MATGCVSAAVFFDGNNSVAVAFHGSARLLAPLRGALFAPLEAALPGRARGAFLWARLRQSQDDVRIALAGSAVRRWAR